MATLLQLARSWVSTRLGASPLTSKTGPWWPLVRESYSGAWQENVTLTVETALSTPTVFRCVSLISTDIAKTPIRLVALDEDGIWQETSSAAFSPVLRQPNRYQTMPQLLEQWMFAKLLHGNAYLLKRRDERNVVNALYGLDPLGVTPMVAPDGAVYYELHKNDLAGIVDNTVIPASEIIHDRWNCAYHPLVGLSPLYACGGAATQMQQIQAWSTGFFGSGGRPNGLLLTPNELDQDSARRLSDYFNNLGAGKSAVGFNLKFQDIPAPSAVDSQVSEQLAWSTATIAGCFGVPISYVDSSKQPPYANSEATALQYASQALQSHMKAIEDALDAGLELPAPYGTEFDLDYLILMDTKTKTTAAQTGISAGALTPNEARYKYFGLGPVPGGETPYLQQQYHSLAALADRDAAAPIAPSEPTEEAVAATVGDLAES
jgi:HK97 family phage portal protein